jgi:hypothetical protein
MLVPFSPTPSIGSESESVYNNTSKHDRVMSIGPLYLAI